MSVWNKPLRELEIHKPKYVMDHTDVGGAIKLMREFKIGSLLVVNEKVELVGIITERDVLMKVVGLATLESPVSDFMTKSPLSLSDEDTLKDAFMLMKTKRFRHVPIVKDGNCPIGILSIKDIADNFEI